MKKLIPFICLVVISLIYTKISLGHPRNLDRFHKLVIFGDSLSDNERALLCCRVHLSLYSFPNPIV